MRNQFILGLIMFLFGNASWCTAEPELRLGVTLPLTGPWASWGTELRQGLELASDTHPKIELIFMDDHCDSLSALSNTRALISSKQVDGVIAGCVEVIDAISPVLQRSNLPLFALGGMDEDLLMRHPNLISLFAMSDLEARYLAKYLSRELPSAKVGLLHHSQRFGIVFGDGLIKEANRLGLEVRVREELAWDGTDFRSEVTRLIQSGADSLVIHMGEDSLVALLGELSAQGFSGKIFTTHVFEGTLKKMPENSIVNEVEYTYPSQQSLNNTEYLEFAKAFTYRFSIPPAATSPIGFDALHWIAVASDNCSSLQVRCLKEYFQGKVMSGVSGELKLDDLGRSIRPFGLKKYQQGKINWLRERL